MGIEENAAILIMTFRDSIGDLKPPDYSFWLDLAQPAIQIDKAVVIGVIWTVWVMKSIIMIIVLLNFLIAVIG